MFIAIMLAYLALLFSKLFPHNYRKPIIGSRICDCMSVICRDCNMAWIWQKTSLLKSQFRVGGLQNTVVTQSLQCETVPHDDRMILCDVCNCWLHCSCVCFLARRFLLLGCVIFAMFLIPLKHFKLSGNCCKRCVIVITHVRLLIHEASELAQMSKRNVVKYGTSTAEHVRA